ncbi:MAG: fluoride efflux transporter CrcB [Anaerocolumna sp.]
MRKYILISIGGFIGAILRYVVRSVPIGHYNGRLPLNTLIINVTGSFVLALVLTAAYAAIKLKADIRLGIATGLIGAYTTFSTLCKETESLLSKGDYFTAISYVTISALLGVGAVYLGTVLGKKIVSKRSLLKPEPDSVCESEAK